MKAVSQWTSALSVLAIAGSSLAFTGTAFAADTDSGALPTIDNVETSTLPAEEPQSSSQSGALETATEASNVAQGSSDLIDATYPEIAQIRASANSGDTVTTQGWVTAAYPTGGFAGFVIQTAGSGGNACDFSGESDAIFVYTNHSNNVAPVPEVGQYVEVTGTYGQYSGLDQISFGNVAHPTGSFTVLDPSNVAPAEPISCQWPESTEDLSSIQSMLYQPQGDFVVTNNYQANQYGSITLATKGEPLSVPTDVAEYGTPQWQSVKDFNAVNKVTLDDGSSFTLNKSPNTDLIPPYISADGKASVGAIVTFDEPVVVDYRNNEWKLNPTHRILGDSDAQPVTFDYERPAAPTAADLGNPDITVGGFNLQNYFPVTLAENWAGGCTPYKDRTGNPTNAQKCNEATVNGKTSAGPRGAWNQESLDRQSGKIAAAINQLDASALGVMELENSYKLSFGDESKLGASAQYLVEVLNTQAGYEKWDYVTPNALMMESYEEQDVMYPGIIYQPAEVTPIGTNVILGDQSGTGEPFANARAPFGQAFEPAEGGRPFLLVANHFKSKSSGDDAVGDNADLGQGAFNGDRTRQAEALTNWIETTALDLVAQESGKTVEDVVLVGDFNSYTFEDPMLSFYEADYLNANVVDGKTEGVTYNYSGENGSLDHVLISSSAQKRLTGHALWSINHPENIALGYDRFEATAGDFVQDTLDTPWRSSDHDPALVGFTATEPPVELQLLNINDFHGRIDGKLNEQKDSLTESSTVNFAYTTEQLRKNAGPDNTLLLSAGDNVGASLFASAIQKDQPTIDLLNVLGLRASAVGNHEFDQGWQDIARLWEEFDGPLLGANVYEKGTETVAAPLEEYTLLEAAGLKVAVIGAITQETPTLVSPDNVSNLSFGDPVDAVNRVTAELMALPEDERPDVIVAEYHEGAGEGQQNSTLGNEIAASPVFDKIVNQTSADVDVIFTGHTHKEYAWDAPVPGQADKTRPIVQTGSYGQFLGQVVLSVDSAAGDVVDYTAANVPVQAAAASDDMTSMEVMRSNPVVEDAYQIVLKAMQHADEEGSVVTGSLTAAVTRAYTAGDYINGVWQFTDGSAEDRGEASPMATLVGNMLKESMENLPAAPDFGVLNPGGLRTDLCASRTAEGVCEQGEGDITVAMARAVLPFNNELSIVSLTGSQVVTMLEQQWQRDAKGEVPSRPYLQLGLSDNVSYTYRVIDDPAAPGNSKGVIESVTINGEPLDPDRTYRIGTFAFLAAGGDNFHVFNEASEVVNTGLLDWESWLSYLKARSPITPDFARQGIQVEGLPDGNLISGSPMKVTYSRSNIHALGAPANSEVSVSMNPLLRSTAFSAPVSTSFDEERGVWTDSAIVEGTVPAGIDGDVILAATFAPTDTHALSYASVASAPDVDSPSITINKSTVAAGGKVQVEGKNWKPGDQVALSLGEVALQTVTANSDGSFTATVSIPSDTKAGAYLLTATNGTDVASARLAVTTVTEGKLVQTGSTALMLMIIALAAVSGGVALYRFSTRKAS